MTTNGKIRDKKNYNMMLIEKQLKYQLYHMTNS